MKPDNHLPKNYGFRSAEAAKFPEMVVCGMSFVCNARCIHCPNAATGFSATLKGADRLMKWETLRRIADECALYPHSLVRVSTAGEILVHPEAVEMMEYILSVKKDGNVALTTNGSLLTPDKSLRLLKAGIRAVEISVDASDVETYEKIRVGLSFEVLMRNVTELVRLRDSGGYKTKIMVSVIEQEANESRLEEINAFWHDRADEVLIRKLLTFKGVIPREKKYEAYLPREAPCPFLWERVLVDAAGDVRACVSDLRNESCLGNVNDTSIAGLWRSDLIESWRRLHLEGKRDEAKPCRGCEDLEYRSWTYNYFDKRLDELNSRDATALRKAYEKVLPLDKEVGGITVKDRRKSGNRRYYEIEAKQNGILIDFESWNRNWELRVNGEVKELNRAFQIFRVVRIEPGLNRIELVYNHGYFMELFILSIAAMFIYIILFVKTFLSIGTRPL